MVPFNKNIVSTHHSMACTAVTSEQSSDSKSHTTNLRLLLNNRMLCLAGIVISTDPVEACKDVDVAVMVGGFPRKGGMERKDVMAKNVAIYKSQAAALEKGAKPDVKVWCF